MHFKVSAVLASVVAAVSLATQQKDDPATEDKPLSDGNGNAVRRETYPVSLDMLIEILSFLPPFEWAGLRTVNVDFYGCLRLAIGEYFDFHGVPLDPTVGFKAIICRKKTINEVLESVMDQPGFRGAIFNKDECTLINHSLRGSQVCSESGFKGKVRVTGVVNVEDLGLHDSSKCNGYFLHYNHADLLARNIRTGQDINISDLHYHDALNQLLNEKQVLIVKSEEILMYELDWDNNTAERVLRESKDNSHPWDSQICSNDPRKISVLCSKNNRFHSFDIVSKQWDLIKETEIDRNRIYANGQSLLPSSLGISIDSTLLKIGSYSIFWPSPDNKFAGFPVLSEYGMINLQSDEVTVIPDIDIDEFIYWFSETLFRMRRNDGRFVLRCAHNPCVDVVTLNQDDSMIARVNVGDEVSAGDLFYHLRSIGPNLYYSKKWRKTIQVEWMDNHQH